MKMNFKNYCAVLVMLLVSNVIMAQSTPTVLYRNVPSDSLMFLLYINKLKVENEALLEKTLDVIPSDLQEVLEPFTEFCFYGQNFDIYDAYRIDFRSNGNLSMDDVNAVLKNLDLTVKDFSNGIVTLEGEDNRYACFYQGEDFATLKIFSQIGLVDENLRAQSKRLLDLPYDEYDWELNSQRNQQLDSLHRLDSLTGIAYFERLLAKEHDVIKRGDDYQKVKKPKKFKKELNSVVDDKALLVYTNAMHLKGLPFHLYRAFSFDTFGMNELFLEGNSGFGIYEDMWLGVSIDTTQILVDSYLQNKNGTQYNYRLDKDILRYLPAQKPEAIVAFNANITEIKQYLIKQFSYHEMDEETQGFMKLALLAFDDELLSSIGNGFLSVQEGEAFGRDFPQFKAAFELPNVKKGQLLLDVLCDEFRYFNRVSKSRCIIASSIDSEEKLYVSIVNNAWLIGTVPFDQLEQSLTSEMLKQTYPQLSKKGLSQYAIFKQELLDSNDDFFKSVELNSYLLNKTTLKSNITISY